MTARHADVVEEVAALGVDILLEKPFAASLADADRILAAVTKAGMRLAINWPLRWYPAHVTAKRLIDEGVDRRRDRSAFLRRQSRAALSSRRQGCRVGRGGPPREAERRGGTSKAAGGGSLLDYLGYGATLGTWFMNGEAPIDVTAVVDQPPGSRSTSIPLPSAATRAASRSSRRAGARSPTHGRRSRSPNAALSSSAPRARFRATTTSRMSACRPARIRRSATFPSMRLKAPFRKPVEYVLHCKENNLPFEGPLDPALCRTAQRIVDTAARSAEERRTLALLP